MTPLVMDPATYAGVAFDTPANRLSCTLASAPGTGGNFSISAPRTGHTAFGAGHDGKTFSVAAVDGVLWEVRTGCAYTHSTATLSRGTLEQSSSGGAVNLSADAVVSVVLSAKHATALMAQPQLGGAAALGLSGPTYVNRSITEWSYINGVEVNSSPPQMAFHDLFAYPGTLRNPLTGKTNLQNIQHGQQLVAIPGATSAPYWTDPGPVTLSRAADNTGVNVPLHLLYEGGAWVFRSLPGYGNAAAGLRRVQMNFGPIRARRRLVWDLSFQIHPDDDVPHDVASGYSYPFLLWQIKAGAFPCQAMFCETRADGTLNLVFSFKWSSDTTDLSTYIRQYNAFGDGFASAQASLRLFEMTITKGQWLDVVIETFLDEREVDVTGNGRGYINVWVNGVQTLCYTGPTLTQRDTGGVAPGAPNWYVGCYRYEGGVPSHLRELDLNREVDPAPYTRAIAYRRAKLMDLGLAY